MKKEDNWTAYETEEKADNEVREISTLTYSEVSKWASGVCDKCHERYTAAPIIKGKPQCPNCDSI